MGTFIRFKNHGSVCKVVHASLKVWGCMKGRRLGMQGRHPRSSAAFLHGQVLSCFSRPECSVAHVLRVARRSVKHSIFKDTAADPFHGSCVHRHGALCIGVSFFIASCSGCMFHLFFFLFVCAVDAC